MRLDPARNLVKILPQIALLAGVGLYLTSTLSVILPQTVIPSAHADDSWKPFAEQDRREARRKHRRGRRSSSSRPAYGGTAPLTGSDAAVQSEELAPLSGAANGQLPDTNTDYNRAGRRPNGGTGDEPGYGRSTGDERRAIAPRDNGWKTYRSDTQPENRRNDLHTPNGRRPFASNQPPGRSDFAAPTRADGGFDRNRRFGPQPGGRDQGAGLAAQASLPADFWRGLTSKQIEDLVAGLKIPPRSPALHALWRRLWLSPARPENDVADESSGSIAGDNRAPRNYHDALALEALYRSGLVGDVANLSQSRDDGTDTLLATLHARALIGIGRAKEACSIAKQSVKPNAAMPKRIKGQALLVMGYCAVASNNAASAGLAADLAREEVVQSPLAFAVMYSVANGLKPRLDVPDRMTLLDLRFLQLVSSADLTDTLDNAEPAVLGALAADEKTKPALRLAAAERGARLNAVSARAMASVYRAQRFNRADIADPLPTRSTRPKRRALLFQAVEAARDPVRRARFMQALFKLAKRDRLHFIVAKILLRPLSAMRISALGRFSETAADIAVTGGDYMLARRWAAGSDRGRLDHWMALIDIADPNAGAAGGGGRRGADLPALEELAAQKRFKSADLHRLATVLDALEYNVPIPLWQAASKTPQPSKGYLPKTGVLPRLAAAAKRGEAGRTALLALRTIGPKGALGAHMIALGDTIRALRAAGLETAARRLAFEALIDAWPRRSGRI